MTTSLIGQLASALAEYSSASRLIKLTIGEGHGARDGLLVEAFMARDAIQEVGHCDVIALSTSAFIDTTALLGHAATLEVTLADGARAALSGEVSTAAMLGSDGGLARYRLRISCWLWRLAQVRNCRVWQDKSVIEIVDAVFAAYRPFAHWRWSDDVHIFMRDVPARSYCCQYRESDLDFVHRVLAQEGLCWRVEHDDGEHALVLFADSNRPGTLPEDASSASGSGVRYHGASPVEQDDTVQTLAAQQHLHASLVTVLSTNDKSSRIVGANAPAYVRNPRLPELEIFDVPGQNAYPSDELARRYADVHMQAIEARSQQWQGRSSVRTLRAGTRLKILKAPLQRLGAAGMFTVVRVIGVGINNLPPPAQHALAELFGPIPELLGEVTTGLTGDMALAIAQAQRTGYANCFDAIPADVPWRPRLHASNDCTHAKPTAHGAQSAIVVGPDGSDIPDGANELHCDRLGRVRIRFHWQTQDNASCWVRVAQRSAGERAGCQFLPRIGQEVLVQFLENDIDRPVIVGALYNGQGEGGIAPTPGGQRLSPAAHGLFERAHDQAPSAQGNLAGGNSPVWHGASPDHTGHGNGGAQWGIRSKEFGGTGYSQLLFDDTDAQGRVQLKCTHAASELNLGHLIHAADNYRGSFRGLGAELRTDAYGAIRAGAGLLITSYRIAHSATTRDAAGANEPGIGLLKQATNVAETMHAATTTHQTVGLASHSGVGKNMASLIDEKAPPLKAMLAALSGDADTLTKPLIAIVAKDGLGVIAGQSLQLSNGETISLFSGLDTQCIVGGAMRVHSGQALGILGGSVGAGADGIGLQLIAAQEAIDIQSQIDGVTVQARDDVNVTSANAHIDWAAARSISLATAGGASIVIDGGNITVQCPGKLTIRAGKKSFTGPETLNYEMPPLPRSICLECLKKSLAAGPAFTMVE